MNLLTCIGNVGKDAALKTVGSDQVANFSVAINSGYGEKKQTVWLDCALWGKRAEKVYSYIRKGDRIGVSGELGTREHDGKTYLTLRVNEVTLLGEKKADTDEPAREQRAARPNTDTGGANQARGGDPESDIPFAVRERGWAA